MQACRHTGLADDGSAHADYTLCFLAILGKEAGADDTMIGKSSHQLGKLSYPAFVESTKVRLFAN
jgi:hypothetical protein